MFRCSKCQGVESPPTKGNHRQCGVMMLRTWVEYHQCKLRKFSVAFGMSVRISVQAHSIHHGNIILTRVILVFFCLVYFFLRIDLGRGVSIFCSGRNRAVFVVLPKVSQLQLRRLAYRGGTWSWRWSCSRVSDAPCSMSPWSECLGWVRTGVDGEWLFSCPSHTHTYTHTHTHTHTHPPTHTHTHTFIHSCTH